MAQSKYLTAPPATTEMPGGIPYIVGNEAAERFSFYGMRTILVIFMTQYLLNTQGNQAPMSEAEAKSWYHLFVASAYFFPIAGAFLSDVFLGKYKTILSLSIVYCLGHLALALDETRIGLAVGLTLIAIGTGAIKPCVSAHVGDQFGQQNQYLLSKVFGWFYFSINLGAFASTLLTPKLLDWFGPHVAFGVPGALMFLATWIFWLGRYKFVHVPAGGKRFLQEVFSREGLAAIVKLSLIYVFVAVFWSLFDQTGSAWVLQARRMDRHWLGVHWLPSQVQAANPLLILTLIPAFSYAVYPAINRVFPLTPLRRISIGFFVTAAAFVVPALIAEQMTGGLVVKKDSEGDPSKWPAENLLDGRVDGTGWISQPREAYRNAPDKEMFPQEIVIRLRERRPWTISAVRINPYTELAGFLREQDDETGRENAEGADLQERSERCRANEIEVLAADERTGPWVSVGRTTLEPANQWGKVEFSPVETEYVMLRIHSNHGGEYVSLGEAEVLAAGTMPNDAHPHAAAVWPNVAATGFKPSIVWQLLAYVVLTAGEVMVSITCLEFSYTQAPRTMKSFIMALFLLSVTLGNAFTSAVNFAIQNEDGSTKLEGANYYWFFTLVMLATAVGFIFVAANYREKTYIQGDEAPEGPGEPTTMACPVCGETIVDGAGACASCGRVVTQD